ncbi:helix-turn-helix domain-containing protein [Chloroflexota bacterium]
MSIESLTMTITEFAAVCSISRGLAYDLARRDKLPVPVIKLGKRMVLSRKAVVALLEAGKQLVPEGVRNG